MQEQVKQPGNWECLSRNIELPVWLVHAAVEAFFDAYFIAKSRGELPKMNGKSLRQKDLPDIEFFVFRTGCNRKPLAMKQPALELYSKLYHLYRKK